jgi:DNA-binding response OmpR family regulator
MSPLRGHGVAVSLYLQRVSATVLVVEDEPDLAYVMRVALTRAGFQVHGEAAGEAARSLARQVHPDAVVMDRGLPDMDGLEAVGLLRSDGYRGPILVVSGWAGAEHVSASRAAGADAVLAKPFALADLVEQVRLALGTDVAAEAG